VPSTGRAFTGTVSGIAAATVGADASGAAATETSRATRSRSIAGTEDVHFDYLLWGHDRKETMTVGNVTHINLGSLGTGGIRMARSGPPSRGDDSCLFVSNPTRRVQVAENHH
jgi:hypothetical protein